jgi:Tol biopolymer transport system component
MSTLAKRLFTSALTLCLMLLLATAAFSQTRVNGKIAFASTRDNNLEIYTMNPDGSNVVRLTSNTTSDDEPTWSPDGLRIAYRCFGNPTGNPGICVMNADGSGQIRLTDGTQADEEPAWSFDGRSIAFARNVGLFQIFTMNADGTNPTQQTNLPTNNNNPSWSPDGQYIAFGSNFNFDFEVAKVFLFNHAVTNLTNSPGADFNPAWSSDGRIAFTSFRDGNSEIYVMNSDGTNQFRVTNATSNEDHPAWSPDNTRIAFDTNRNTADDVYTINVNGTNETRLTVNFVTDEHPDWQPIREANSGDVIISEFRFRGTAGPADEFIELYNTTDSAFIVNTTDGSAGWTLAALSPDGASASAVFTIANGTVIPARTHYLAVNNSSGGYSLGGYASADTSYTFDIADNVGIALFKTAAPANWTLANRLDAAGFSSATNDLYREGVGLTPIGTGNGEFSFVRNLVSGFPNDTNNNAADFLFVSTQAEVYGSVQSILGAPGPDNLASPLNRTGLLTPSLVDPNVSSSQSPNRVRKTCSDPTIEEQCNPLRSRLGTLAIRRTYTNNQNFPVTRMRFRIVDVTTYPAPVGTADLRAITSSDVTVTRSNGTSALVRGTTLEGPSAQSPLGGGLNASMSLPVITLATPLNPGESVNVQFVTGVQQSGSFRFFVTIDLMP